MTQVRLITQRPLEGARILIAEDEGLIADELEERLRRMGLTVVGSVSSAEDALSLVELSPPDVVLMDIRLGGEMDGIDAAAVLRDRHHLPVVYLTAHSDDATIRRAKLTEPFGYLLKPFDERDLRIVLEMALHKHDMERRLRETEEQLREAQKMEAIGRLAGGVAHDINNMMTVVLGYAELLLSRFDASDPEHAMLDEMKRAADRSAGITRQLLAFGRRQVLQPVVVDINRFIGEIAKMLTRLLGADIDVRYHLEADTASVLADPGQLDQVILNLCLNARDAMPEGGVLTIRTHNVSLDESFATEAPDVEPGMYVMVSVSDTGVGMDAATRAHVFEPFFTTKQIGEGTGLGLATVYGIVRQSGGHIYVHSEPNHGTTFKVYLPRDLGSTATTTEPQLAAPRGHETVLLVEDEQGVRSMTANILRRHGYSVVEAGDGAEALRLCQSEDQHIDLLLTDSIMPNMSGRALADGLRRQRPQLKVLFMSGYTDDRILRQGAMHERDAFIQKPFSGADLARRVRGVLDGPA